MFGGRFPPHQVSEEDHKLANHVSAKKRAKQNLNRRARNRARMTRVRSTIKDVRQAVASGDAAAAQAALQVAVPVIDKAAAQGVIHRKNASRKVSRLSTLVQSLNS